LCDSTTRFTFAGFNFEYQTGSSNFLQTMITKGVEHYQIISSKSSVKHWLAEEVLQQEQGKLLFPVQLIGISI
jgi:hypothetical protein